MTPVATPAASEDYMRTLGTELEIGLAAARAAGDVALRHLREGVGFEEKPDLSPVTVADREAERIVSQIITQAFPDDGLLGEEGADRESANGRRWIIDPIDGTRDFIRKNPLWATLIGLEIDGEIVAGFANFAQRGEIYYAVEGGGAFRNGERIHASHVASVESAVLCMNGLNKIEEFEFAPRLNEWMSRFWAVRSMGGAPDCMAVCSGQADLWIEPTAKPWDLAALKIIAKESGAAFFDFDGHDSIYGGNCVVCTPALAAEARRFIGIP